MNPKIFRIIRISLYSLTFLYFLYQAYNAVFIPNVFKSVVSLLLASYITAISMLLLVNELKETKS